jgi:hypothetical protein
MLKHRIVIISTDPGMRRGLNRLMTATGLAAIVVGCVWIVGTAI